VTYRSLFIDEYPDRASAEAPYDRLKSVEHTTFCSLQAYTWPFSAQGFAEAWKLPVDYVDNAWLLVPVSPELARKFLRTGANIDPDIPGLIERINDDKWYVINEEEF